MDPRQRKAGFAFNFSDPKNSLRDFCGIILQFDYYSVLVVGRSQAICFSGPSALLHLSGVSDATVCNAGGQRRDRFFHGC